MSEREREKSTELTAAQTHSDGKSEIEQRQEKQSKHQRASTSYGFGAESVLLRCPLSASWRSTIHLQSALPAVRSLVTAARL